MKSLINLIIRDSGLELEELKYQDIDISFSYFKDKYDFFVFLFCDYNELYDKLKLEEYGDLEYALNEFVFNLKNKYLNESHNNKDLDNNLSLIIILKTTETIDNKKLIQLHKVEENYIVVKKYILHYDNTDFSSLNEKIEEIADEKNIVDKLNKLVITNSSLLKEETAWYKLLLSLFVKIPFLNYLPEENQVLENIEDKINSRFSDEQKIILDLIVENYELEKNIEEFINANNLLKDGNSEEL